MNQIVAIWPKPGTEDVEATFSLLRRYLAESFAAIDLQNRVHSVAAMKEVEARSQRAVLYFNDVDEISQRAVFVRSETHDWKLESLKFQCPVCFGTGENDSAKCTICGGVGWGGGSSVS